MKKNECIYYHDLSTQAWKKVQISFSSTDQTIQIKDFNDS
jgi:hypothetical protein